MMSTKKTEPKSRSQRNARLLTNPTFLGSSIFTQMWKGHGLETEDILNELAKINEKIIINGSIQYLESLLLNQVHLLNAMFVQLSTIGMKSNYLKNTSIYVQLGLNAQKQARATIATIANLKNPQQSPTFIKQQNNAVNQQVNNGNPETQIPENSKKIPANELLSEVSHETLDTRSKSATSTDDSALEAVVESRC